MQEATASTNYQPQPWMEPTESSGWTRQQDKLLELLLCFLYPRWDRIALHLRVKTPDQACRRYQSLVAALRRVLEAPQVEMPPEWDLQQAQTAAPTLTAGNAVLVTNAGGDVDDKAASATVVVGEDTAAPACMAADDTSERPANHKRGRKNSEGRSKAVPWSRDEHRLFLAGIKKHGKGKWQQLSKEFVTTRNASQIASHYQKYTIRQDKLRQNECKRPSIHDISDDTPGAADRGDEKPATAAGGAERWNDQ